MKILHCPVLAILLIQTVFLFSQDISSESKIIGVVSVEDVKSLESIVNKLSTNANYQFKDSFFTEIPLVITGSPANGFTTATNLTVFNILSKFRNCKLIYIYDMKAASALPFVQANPELFDDGDVVCKLSADGSYIYPVFGKNFRKFYMKTVYFEQAPLPD